MRPQLQRVVVRSYPVGAVALLYAAALLFSGRACAVPPPTAVALGAAGAALGRKGLLVLVVGAGLLVGTLRGDRERRAFDRVASETRPTTVHGGLSGCWDPTDNGVTGIVRTETLARGLFAAPLRLRLRVYVGGDEPPRGCGGRWRLTGFLRAPRQFRNAPEVRTGGWYLQSKSARLVERLEVPRVTSRVVAAVRGSLESPSEAPSEGELLARAMILGRGRDLPPRWRLALRRYGLSHVVAVSGLHVGMVMLGALALGSFLPPTAKKVAVVLAIVTYGVLVGPRPSLLRAVLMASIVGAGLLLRRPGAGLRALAITICLLLTEDPGWAGDLGFQLSFAATAGILLFAPLLQIWSRALPRSLAAVLGVTVAAQIATLPWAFGVFHRIPLIAPLSNLLAFPWLAATLSVSALWAFAGAVSPGAGVIFERMLEALARPIDWLAEVSPPVWLMPTVTSPWWSGLAVSMAIGLVLRSRVRWRGGLAALAAVTLIIVLAEGWTRGTERVSVTFFDVGQGDAALLADGGRGVLVDGGGWRRPGFGDVVVRPAIAGQNVRRLWAMVVSHPDRDHCGGILDLAESARVEELWMGEIARGSSCARALLPLFEGRVRWLQEGDRVERGKWSFIALGPSGAGPRFGDNDGSLVLLAEALGQRVLLTGDIEARSERHLVRRWGGRLRADLLKVPHHGSKSSSTGPFLDLVDPRLAVISCGRRNRFGHPSSAVTTRLEKGGTLVLRTDWSGMVRVSWAGPWGRRVEVSGDARGGAG